KQHLGVSDCLPGARDSDRFDLVCRVTQTGGIDDIHGHAVDLNGLTHRVACGARNLSDDSEVFSGKPVEERRFSYVRPAGQYDLKSAAKNAALTAGSVGASIRSATASACARSSLSFRKARRVNSPGSARRAPSSRHRLRIMPSTTGPP